MYNLRKGIKSRPKLMITLLIIALIIVLSLLGTVVCKINKTMREQKQADQLLEKYSDYKLGEKIVLDGYTINAYSAKIENSGYKGAIVFEYTREDHNKELLGKVDDFSYADAVAPLTGGGSGGERTKVYRTKDAVYLEYTYHFDSFEKDKDVLIAFMKPSTSMVTAEFNAMTKKWQNVKN